MSGNIFCIGELLIDMVCVDNKGLINGEKFEKKAGGAPANVAASICKLEGNAYFLGQVGDDFFGTYLIDLLIDDFSISNQPNFLKTYSLIPNKYFTFLLASQE